MLEIPYGFIGFLSVLISNYRHAQTPVSWTCRLRSWRTRLQKLHRRIETASAWVLGVYARSGVVSRSVTPSSCAPPFASLFPGIQYRSYLDFVNSELIPRPVHRISTRTWIRKGKRESDFARFARVWVIIKGGFITTATAV